MAPVRAVLLLARHCGWAEADLDEYCRHWHQISFRLAPLPVMRELYIGLLQLRQFQAWQRHRASGDEVIKTFNLQRTG